MNNVGFFIDECLSPELINILSQFQSFFGQHAKHCGMSGYKDHSIYNYAISNNLIIVTANGKDFEKLCGKFPNSPGLIIMPPLKKEPSQKAFETVLIHIHPNIISDSNWMKNRIINVENTKKFNSPLNISLKHNMIT
jgi:predicted nuclease of predicted toxin-antitoxin system